MPLFNTAHQAAANPSLANMLLMRPPSPDVRSVQSANAHQINLCLFPFFCFCVIVFFCFFLSLCVVSKKIIDVRHVGMCVSVI